MPSYRGYRFPPDIISHAVWLYHRVGSRYRAESLPSRATPPAVGSPPSAPYPRVRCMRCGDVRLLRTLGGVDVMGQERAALNKLTMPPPMGRDRVLVWSPNKLIVVLNLGRALQELQENGESLSNSVGIVRRLRMLVERTAPRAPPVRTVSLVEAGGSFNGAGAQSRGRQPSHLIAPGYATCSRLRPRPSRLDR